MKHYHFLSLVILILFSACSKDDDNADCENPIQNSDTLIFGHFYGECIGEDCIQTYKLSDGQLFEDTLDSYAGSGPSDFILLPQEDYDLVSDLMDFFPNELLSLADSTFGCPDCADQGGLFIRLESTADTSTFIIRSGSGGRPLLSAFIYGQGQ